MLFLGDNLVLFLYSPSWPDRQAGLFSQFAWIGQWVVCREFIHYTLCMLMPPKSNSHFQNILTLRTSIRAALLQPLTRAFLSSPWTPFAPSHPATTAHPLLIFTFCQRSMEGGVVPADRLSPTSNLFDLHTQPRKKEWAVRGIIGSEP